MDLTLDQVNAKIDGMETSILAGIGEQLEAFAGVPEKVNELYNKEVVDNGETYGYNNLAELALDVRMAALNKPTSETFGKYNNIATNVDSDGGFLIPRPLAKTLWKEAIEGNPLYALCSKMPISQNALDVPYVVDSSHAGTTGLYGGIQTYYADEEAEYTGSAPKFGKFGLKLNKLTAKCIVTNEMIEDSPISIMPTIQPMFRAAMIWRMMGDMLEGTGAGQPMGIWNSGGKITVGKELSQDANTIVADNIAKMFARMWSKGIMNSVWIVNQTILPQLMKLQWNTGTAAGTLVYNPPGGLSQAPYGTILGRPVIFTEHAKALGTEGDISFVDFTEYVIGEKVGKGSGFRASTNIWLLWDTDRQAFKISIRWDGASKWKTPFTPKYGDTTSHIITLATRA